MGKVQILAILSMDGCLSGLNPKKRLFRSPEDYGMEEIRGKALYKLTSDYTISILQDWREKEDDTCYLLEADAKTVEYANGLIRMNANHHLYHAVHHRNRRPLFQVRSVSDRMDIGGEPEIR
jgi:hypothetical protein